MPGDLSAECRAHVGHGDKDARQVLRVFKRLEAKIFIEAEAQIEVVVLEYIKDDGCGTHLIGDPQTAPHGVYDEGSSEPFAMHVFAHGNRADVDDRDVRNTGSLPRLRAENRSDGHCGKSIEAEHGRIVVCCDDPSGHYPGFDLVGERRLQKVVNGAKATTKGAAVMQRLVEFRDC